MPAEMITGETKAVCLELFARAESLDLEELLEDAWHLLGEEVFDQLGEESLRAFFVDLIAETTGKD